MTSLDIFNINTLQEFEEKTLAVFKHQFKYNKVYRSFCDLLYKHPSDIDNIEDIPFLPIEFFKSKDILSSDKKIQATFTSSGTTGSNVSKHHVTDLNTYQSSFSKAYHHFYGDIKETIVLALLPSYLERSGSSLIYMVQDFIKKSNQPESGFYLNNLEDLAKKITTLDNSGRKILLIGVSFALLDLIENYSFNLNNTTIMETGGMKGKRKEITRTELHNKLKSGFGVNCIHSEYGMTELLSQAYSKENGLFYCPPWMKIFTRDTDDPLTIQKINKTGGVNIIDLANINSCSFIATQDLGRSFNNGSFEIIGRFDHSDIRGCNLMSL